MAWSFGGLLVLVGLLTILWVTLRAPRRRILGVVALLLGVGLGFALIQLTWDLPPSVPLFPPG